MNDLMSLGVHRLWKQYAVWQSGVRYGQRVLDVAGGSGDLTARLARRVGKGGTVVLADINAAMLGCGRARMIDKGIVENVVYAQCDAERLAFPDDYFDCVSIAFGLRNVTHIPLALESMYRVLKRAGRIVVLEFSHPVLPPLARLYDVYSFAVIPRMGRVVAGDENSYRYLVESIRKHPDQAKLKRMLEAAGFERVRYHNLSGGIVALHRAFKY